jgi:hypothetical protein
MLRSLGWQVFSTRVGPGVPDPQWTESAPIIIPAEVMKTQISDPSMVHQSTHAGITTALRLDHAFVK